MERVITVLVKEAGAGSVFSVEQNMTDGSDWAQYHTLTAQLLTADSLSLARDWLDI